MPQHAHSLVQQQCTRWYGIFFVVGLALDLLFIYFSLIKFLCCRVLVLFCCMQDILVVLHPQLQERSGQALVFRFSGSLEDISSVV